MSQTNHPPRLMGGIAAWAAEARLLWRYVVRTRAIIFWLLAAVIWPLAYVTVLGGGGATPLAVILALAALPLGPILWVLFGARLSMVQGQELGVAWPARGARSVGACVVLVGCALAGSLTTTGSALLGVEPSFWHPAGFAIASLLQGFGMLLPTVVLWMAIGFAIGHRMRGIFRSILPPLAPIAMMFAYKMGQEIVVSGGAPVFGLLSTSAAAWFSQVGAFGIGPWAQVFYLGVLVMGVAAVLLLAVASLCAYGRQLVASLSAAACILSGIGLMISVGQNQAVIQPALIPAARAYRSGAKSPVRVTAEHITLSVLHPPSLMANATLNFTVQQRLRTLRFFLPSSLRIQAIRAQGQDVRFSRSADGWVTALMPALLTPGAHGKLSVAYAGDPYVMAFAGGGSVAQFVSSTGWMLPAGTWYPLLGSAQSDKRFVLRLRAPAGYLSVTPYGVINGSTGAAPLTGTGRSLQIVGGHLAKIADLGGARVYTASDEMRLLRPVLNQRFPGQGSGHTVAACLSQVLRPQPKVNMVWTSTFAGALSPGASPWEWEMGPMFGPGLRGGLGMQNLGGGTVAAFGNDYYFTYPRIYGLWLSGGQRAFLPKTSQPMGLAALRLGTGIFTACGSPYTSGMLGPNKTSTAIAKLPKPALRKLATEARTEYSKGTLTTARLNDLVRAVQQ